MKNSWLIWGFVAAVIVTVFIAFNYQGQSRAVPLSEIFPEDETYPVDVEYEFVDSTGEMEPQVVKDEEEIQEVEEEKVAWVQKDSVPDPKQEIKRASVKAPASVTTEAVSYDPDQIPFTIQVASFKEKSLAEKALKEVTEKNYEGYIVARDLGTKGTWYRIYIGKFNSKDQAENYLSNVRKDYQSSFVIAPKNI